MDGLVHRPAVLERARLAQQRALVGVRPEVHALVEWRLRIELLPGSLLASRRRADLGAGHEAAARLWVDTHSSTIGTIGTSGADGVLGAVGAASTHRAVCTIILLLHGLPLR